MDEKSNCASQTVPVYNNPSCIHGMYTIHWCLQTGERHSIENGRIFCYCTLNNFQSSTGHLILKNRSKIGTRLQPTTTIEAIGGIFKKTGRGLLAFLDSALGVWSGRYGRPVPSRDAGMRLQWIIAIYKTHLLATRNSPHGGQWVQVSKYHKMYTCTGAPPELKRW